MRSVQEPLLARKTYADPSGRTSFFGNLSDPGTKRQSNLGSVVKASTTGDACSSYSDLLRMSRNTRLQRKPVDDEPFRVKDATEDDAAEVFVDTSSVEPQSAMTRNIHALRTIFWHPFSLLLLCFPLGIVSYFLEWSPLATFFLNFFALIPLAKILGDATEELDAGLHNEIISGLLNATFGNAVEMIITVQSLKENLILVVQGTLLGSILSNMLLVLGCAFFFGGIIETRGQQEKANTRANAAQHWTQPNSLSGASCDSDAAPLVSYRTRLVMEKEQSFKQGSTMVSVSMLLMSCMSWALPTFFMSSFGTEVGGRQSQLQISRTCAIIMMLSYVAYLVFQLFTHKDVLNSEGEQDDEEEEEDDQSMTIWCSILLLFATTVATAISSEFLVRVLRDVVDQCGMSELFIGVILLPIVGNACEHVAAVRFAVLNKPGLAVSIAVGSSTQVSLLVIPFAVILGWIMDKPMDLNFGILNTTVLTMSVLVVLSIVVNGRSNWLEGWVLCSAYAIIGVMYWHVKHTNLSVDQALFGIEDL